MSRSQIFAPKLLLCVNLIVIESFISIFFSPLKSPNINAFLLFSLGNLVAAALIDARIPVRGRVTYVVMRSKSITYFVDSISIAVFICRVYVSVL